jgi:DNA polymerase-1
LSKIPIKNAYGRDCVEFGRPGRARKFVGADYSQIELRLLALFTREPALVEAFKNDEDLHISAAETVLGRPATGTDRNYGKIVNFGVRAYGGGPHALIGAALGYGILLNHKEAAKYVKAVRDANPTTERWGKDQLALMQEQGYLQTPMGHRRWLEGEDRETVARNTPIQCVASELLKDGIRILYPRLREEFTDAHLILQVHDEVGVDCDAEDAGEVEKLVKECLLESGRRWMEDIPCEVESYISNSWEK